MFGLFRKKVNLPEKLYLKGAEEAFAYAVEYLAAPLEVRGRIVGLVQGPGEPFKSLVPSSLRKQFNSGYYRVSLATNKGVVCVENCSSIADRTGSVTPNVGDLVAVECASYNHDIDVTDSRNYFVIVATLEPVLDMKCHFFVPKLAKP